MSTLIQIRNVPEDLHRRAKARAALAGLTLSELALEALRREVERPTMAEIAARVRLLPEVRSPVPVEEIIRQERDTR